MKKLYRFMQLSWLEQCLLIRAAWWLGILTLGLRIVPLSTLQHLLLKLATRRMKTVPAPLITWAIQVAGRFVPEAACLPQALAAQYLFVKSGYPAELQIGVARSADGKLEAHAWVISGGSVVIGDLCDLDRFAPLLPTHRAT
jgi:hypothetical protein